MIIKVLVTGLGMLLFGGQLLFAQTADTGTVHTPPVQAADAASPAVITADSAVTPAAAKAGTLPDTARVRISSIRVMPASPAEYRYLRVRVSFSGPMDTVFSVKGVFGPSGRISAHTLAGTWLTPEQWEGRILFSDIADPDAEMTLRVSSGKGGNGTLPEPAERTFRTGYHHLFYQGADLFRTGKDGQARQVLTSFLEKVPDNADALVILARVEARSGNGSAASGYLEQALTADPLHSEALYRTALHLRETGDNDRAGELLDLSFRLQKSEGLAGPLVYLAPDRLASLPAPVILPGSDDNSTAALLVRVGALSLENREWDKAAECFARVTEMLPRSAAARCNAATAFLWAGNRERAEKEVFQALSMDADLREARCNLGVVLCENDSAAAALREYEKAAGAPDLDAVLGNNSAVALIRSGDAVRGRKKLASLAAQDNMPVTVYYNGAVISETGSVRGILQKMGSGYPAHPLTAYAGGLAAASEERAKDAGRLFRTALAADPFFPAACLEMGRLEIQARNYPVAQVWLQRAVRMAPDDPRPHSMLGQVFGALGMKEKELASYDTANRLKRARQHGSKRADAKIVAVASFDNTGASGAYGWLATGIAEAVGTDLKKLSGVRLVERLKVEKLMQEKMLAAADLLKNPSVVKGKGLDADALITGSFQVSGTALRIDGRIINVKNGQVGGTASVTGTVDSLFALQRAMAVRLLEAMKVALEPEERNELAGNNSGSLKALEYLSEGRNSYYRGDLQASLESMRRAVELDDTYMDALSGMDLVTDEDRLAKTLAVLQFRNASGDETYDWMQAGVAEALVTDLKKVTGLYLVERMDLKKAMDEINLGMTDLVDEATAPKIGRMVGAGVVLIGSYQVIKDNVRIDCRMVDVESGGILMGENVQGPLDDIFELEEHLAFKIADMLNVAVSMAEREQIIRKANPTFNALRSIAIAQASLAEERNTGGGVSVALIRFKNATAEGGKKYDYLQAGITEVLGSELRRTASVQLVDRRVVDAQIGPRNMVRLAGLGTVDREIIPRVPADYVVQGQFSIAGEQLSLRSRLMDVNTLTVLGNETVTGPREKAFTLEQDLARKLALALEKGTAPEAGNAGALSDAGKVPVWWSASATGIFSTVMAYYAYRYGVADDRYMQADANTSAADWNYLDDARTGYYRKRNLFIGMTVTGLAATGGTVVWNKFLRHRFIKEAPPEKRDTKVAYK